MHKQTNGFVFERAKPTCISHTHFKTVTRRLSSVSKTPTHGRGKGGSVALFLRSFCFRKQEETKQNNKGILDYLMEDTFPRIRSNILFLIRARTKMIPANTSSAKSD